MASRILLDAQMTGFIDYVRSLANSPAWESITRGLEVTFTNFPEERLDSAISDREVWHFCQANRLFLLTDNRNDVGIDSLESMIRTANSESCYPVFTIGSRDRFANERSYAERFIEKLLEKLLDAEALLGAGRIYLP